jgi:hypothetical protein
MSTTFEQRTERRVMEEESTSAAAEALGGLAVVVLAILGLAGLVPVYLAGIAGIVFGVTVLAQGTAVAAEYQNLYARFRGGNQTGAVELGGGMTFEIVAGGSAIVLGVLALIGAKPDVLLPALVITGGAALMLSAGTVQRLNNLSLTAAEEADPAHQVTHAATAGAVAGQVLAGIAAAVLGIIALASLSTMAAGVGGAETTNAPSGNAIWLILTLVGLLVLGASQMLTGGSLVSRVVQMFGNNREQMATRSREPS